MDKRTNDYIASLQILVKQRELYKLRNDAQRYLQLGEQNMYERVAPLIQKPITEKLDEVKQVLQTPLVPVSQPQVAPDQVHRRQRKHSYEPIVEVFDRIIEEIAKLPATRKPPITIRVMKTNQGYMLGSTPIEVIFHEIGRDIKINDYQMHFSEDLERLLQMPKVTENGEELKEFQKQTLQDYLNLLTNCISYRSVILTGNYKQAFRILKDEPPGYRVKAGKGIDGSAESRQAEANRVLTLLAAKAEGHNNVDNELKELLN